MLNERTLIELLEGGDESAVALAAPERESLNFGELRDHVMTTVAALNKLGIGRNDPVAIVLPNGPEMASAFLAIAGGATTAPLNPTYTADEFEFYLSDLHAKVLVLEAGSDSPARAAAEKLGLPVAELEWDAKDKSGLFQLHGEAVGDPPPNGGPAQADDVALVLHTSGTTSRPKIVPLNHTNVCATTASVRDILALVPNDHSQKNMPFFHIPW